MSHAARANSILRRLKNFEMSSDKCAAILEDVLNEADVDRKALKEARAEITLLTTNAARRDKQIISLQNQKLKAEGSLSRLTNAKAARNNGDRLARLGSQLNKEK